MQESTTIDIDKIETYNHGHMPIITAWFDRLGLNETFDKNLSSGMNLPISVAVKAMVIDTLCGRSPLYHLEHTFEETDNELLFGQSFHSSSFNDDAIGRILDRIQEYGCEKLYTEISLSVLKLFDLSTEETHFDSTSVNVWGDYKGKPGINMGPNLTHGYSKDKRGDLKQFMISMTCVEGNIPILGKIEDGNSSDENLNNETLIALNQYLKRADRKMGLHIADSKFVCERNVTLLSEEQWLSRLPATYGEHDKLIYEAFETDQWQDLGTLSKTTSKNPKRPSAHYKTYETQTELYGETLRAIVVHTSAKDKRKEKAQTDIWNKKKRQSINI